MLPRSLILLGLCAVLGLSTPAFADVAKPQKPTATSAKSKTSADASKGKKKVAAKPDKKGKVAAKDADKKLTDAEKAKAKAEAKAAAAEKVRQAKLAAMRAKAKADAEARTAAFRAPKQNVVKEDVAKEEPRKKVPPVELAKADEDVQRFGSNDKPVIGMTAERIAAQQAAAVGPDVVVREGNNGELRSGASVVQPSGGGGFFKILFGDEPTTTATSVGMLPETRALDSVLETKKKFKVRPEYEPQSVAFSGYAPGTIVIDTSNHFLYLVEGFGSARRYGIAVGREGLQFKGMVAVGDKQEWPRWIPTLDMQKREPKKYGQYKDGMPGGGQNPLGARAIYLYQGKQDTHLRIHGTIAPQTIGTNSSNGCFRMVNEHVMDLYRRVGVGTKVVIL
ncbi:L,D-transpeptidase family protein [Mesorhizobium sp. ASY16-5R]|uniref:L,D-transpeptidase n=1 Tax=Mesorhizobium sp. ASY16-5R TaxID=3445772 RepID=UPI003FA09EF7